MSGEADRCSQSCCRCFHGNGNKQPIITDSNGSPLPLSVLQAAWAAGDVYHLPLSQHVGKWARALAPAAEAGALSVFRAATLPLCQVLNSNPGQSYSIRAPASSPTDLNWQAAVVFRQRWCSGHQSFPARQVPFYCHCQRRVRHHLNRCGWVFVWGLSVSPVKTEVSSYCLCLCVCVCLPGLAFAPEPPCA